MPAHPPGFPSPEERALDPSFVRLAKYSVGSRTKRGLPADPFSVAVLAAYERNREREKVTREAGRVRVILDADTGKTREQLVAEARARGRAIQARPALAAISAPSAVPGQERAFVHKRVGRAIGGFVTGGVSGAVSGFLTKPTTQPTFIQPQQPRQFPVPQARCPSGFVMEPNGRCRRQGLPGALEQIIPGGSTGFVQPTFQEQDFGSAVSGRFGVGLEPAVETVARRSCPRGMQLGQDGLCYNRGILANKQRAWPKGRAPLLTGGERNAISKAGRAVRKVERTVSTLQKIGIMKKAAPRRQPKPRQQRLLGPGGTSIINVD